MTRLSHFAAFLALAPVAFACQPQTEEPSGPEAIARAMPGDSVWMILNHVKPDQRDSFERFLETVLMPALEQGAPENPLYRNMMDHGRILYPTEANEDGTFTYVYLLERYTAGDYSYRSLLEQVYTTEQTEEYLQIPSEALDRSQEAYITTQTRWMRAP